MIATGVVVAAVKLASIASCGYGAWSVYGRFEGPAIRRTVSTLFKRGDVCHKSKNRKGKEVRKYPLIQRVGVYEDCDQVIFTLPDGLNPNDVKAKEWLFKQGFGEDIELTGNSKTFTLWIYKGDIAPFAYELSEIRKACEGYQLPIIAGRSRKGYVVYDMCEHPHLLIAGETGSGKSVQLRSILSTLIAVAGDRLQLNCADLKRSEFHLFRDIAETVDIETANLHNTLLKLKKEMRKRGDLLDKAGLANINDLPADKRPKYIVLAIDEVALLKKEKDIMGIVEEISAIGRALGVFLILSMQRPDADVLDGKLKNNLTVRMAFRHADEINSRITLGSGEAADIKQSQKGRFYLSLDGLRMMQAPHLELPAAKALLKPHKRQQSEDEHQENELVEKYERALEEAESDDIKLGVL